MNKLGKKVITKGILFILITSQVVLAINKGIEAKEEKHPIDVWYEKCLANSEGGSFEMKDCAVKAHAMWDKEMNKIYKELMKRLPPKQKEALKESQKQWLKFRDAEFDFLVKYYYETNPPGFGDFLLWMEDARMEIVKQRTLQLDRYLYHSEFLLPEGDTKK